MKQPPSTEHAVHDLIVRRWSPRAFVPDPLAEGELRSLLEAARWAPSSFNEQPWRFIVASRDNEPEFDRMLSCVNEGNQTWARNAGALMLSVASLRFARNDKPNRHALHDVGLAVSQLSLQATALGIGVHQMAGFSSDRARELYAIPPAFEPVAALAVGRFGDAGSLSEKMREREHAKQTRRSQADFAFMGGWGESL